MFAPAHENAVRDERRFHYPLPYWNSYGCQTQTPSTSSSSSSSSTSPLATSATSTTETETNYVEDPTALDSTTSDGQQRCLSCSGDMQTSNGTRSSSTSSSTNGIGSYRISCSSTVNATSFCAVNYPGQTSKHYDIYSSRRVICSKKGSSGKRRAGRKAPPPLSKDGLLCVQSRLDKESQLELQRLNGSSSISIPAEQAECEPPLLLSVKQGQEREHLRQYLLPRPKLHIPRNDLSEVLTIVLVTSPIGMHPATTLVDGVIRSMDFGTGLEKCPMVIVADGVRIIPSDAIRRIERPANHNGQKSTMILADGSTCVLDDDSCPVDDGGKANSIKKGSSVTSDHENKTESSSEDAFPCASSGGGGGLDAEALNKMTDNTGCGAGLARAAASCASTTSSEGGDGAPSSSRRQYQISASTTSGEEEAVEGEAASTAASLEGRSDHADKTSGKVVVQDHADEQVQDDADGQEEDNSSTSSDEDGSDDDEEDSEDEEESGSEEQQATTTPITSSSRSSSTPKKTSIPSKNKSKSGTPGGTSSSSKKRKGKQRVVWKRGRVTKEDFDRYSQYCDNLREKYCTGEQQRKTTVIGPLPKHLSFAHALKRGLEEVRTQYVMVVQHDRAFVEPLDISHVVRMMEEEPRIRYVGFQSRTNVNYPNRSRGRYGEWARVPEVAAATHASSSKRGSKCVIPAPATMSVRGGDPENQGEAISRGGVKRQHKGDWKEFSGGRGLGAATVISSTSSSSSSSTSEQHQNGVTSSTSDSPSSDSQLLEEQYKEMRDQVNLREHLIPLFFWYDSTHIVHTEPYKALISRECKQGQFIESTYGVRLEERVREVGNRGAWSFDYHLDHFGSFLLHDRNLGVMKPMVAHLHGRMFWSKEERLQRGWPAVPLFSKYERLARLEVTRRHGEIAFEETICEDGLCAEERLRRRGEVELEEEEDFTQFLFDQEEVKF
ncbi:unnamed protein product [Amoebophrya sp. A25]|nr:unnamed protein product [Amoebophrya sp. A25]|eukprot:GSA25T00004832001.1